MSYEEQIEERAIRFDIPADAPCGACGHGYHHHINLALKERACDAEADEQRTQDAVFGVPRLCNCDSFTEENQ
jgi:hypothetical protein